MSIETLAGGRYRVERLLGHGGMALVYLATDEELARPVAIKLLADNLASDDQARERFVREAKLAARLAHPNIVNVFDAGEDGGRPYIVMEYVAGSTLADELRRRQRFVPEHAVDIAIQVCAGLDHAHRAGLVHRDVKPANLLLRGDGTIKIADFGIARAAESTLLTQVGSVLGTAGYLPPEQASGSRVTATADIYSLGAVLYELLTGSTPYRAESLSELVFKQHERPPRPVRAFARDVPPQLEAVVMDCLALDPAVRPESAADLAHMLAAASPEPPTQPLPERTAATRVVVPQVATSAPTVPLRRGETWEIRIPARWQPRLLVAAAAVLFAVALAVALAAGGDSRDEPAAATSVPRGTTPAEQARNLAEWLRQRSR